MSDINIEVDFGTDEHFGVSFDSGFNVDYSQMHEAGDYMGEYNFTPTNETQEIPTADKTLTQNIIINPIPSNYGLVSYDGSILSIV